MRPGGITALASSHPVRVRGLKQQIEAVKHNPEASHPVRVRGLKRKNL